MINNIQKISECCNEITKQLETINNIINSIETTTTKPKAVKRVKEISSPWFDQTMQRINRIISADRYSYPNVDKVVSTVCIELRRSYGIVIEQLKKEFKSSYGYYPDTLHAIAEYKIPREIFTSLLTDMESAVCSNKRIRLNRSCTFTVKGNCYYMIVTEGGKQRWLSTGKRVDTATADEINRILETTVIANNIELFKDFHENIINIKSHKNIDSVTAITLTLDAMECDWDNLTTRFKNKYNTMRTPTRVEILINSPSLKKKFRLTANKLGKE